MIASLKGDDAPKMQRVDVLRIFRQRLTVKCVGFRQPPDPVMLQAHCDTATRFFDARFVRRGRGWRRRVGSLSSLGTEKPPDHVKAPAMLDGGG